MPFDESNHSATILASFPVQEAFDMLNACHKKDLEVNGYLVKKSSARYKLFMSNAPKKGIICCVCGCVGTKMNLVRYEQDKSCPPNRAHFNLYTDDGVMLTKDHIIPKSWGGRDTASNYQTMCAPCNNAKANHFAGSEPSPDQEYIGFHEAQRLMVDEGEILRPAMRPNMAFLWDGAYFLRYDDAKLFRKYTGVPRGFQKLPWCITPFHFFHPEASPETTSE